MTARDKIQEAKNYFKDIKESGRNNYQKFSYLETKDIFPIIRLISHKFKLNTQFSKDIWYDQPVMKLTITDQDDKTSEEFIVNIPEIKTSDPGKYMQDVGRIQTYAMRYLYIQAFEIAVPDEIDNKDQAKMGTKTHGKKIHKAASRGADETPDVVPTEAPFPADENEINDVLDLAYHNIVVEGGKEFTEARALWQLKRICKDKPVLLDNCKEHLKIYTANKIKVGENKSNIGIT